MVCSLVQGGVLQGMFPGSWGFVTWYVPWFRGVCYMVCSLVQGGVLHGISHGSGVCVTWYVPSFQECGGLSGGRTAWGLGRQPPEVHDQALQRGGPGGRNRQVLSEDQRTPLPLGVLAQGAEI